MLVGTLDEDVQPTHLSYEIPLRQGCVSLPRVSIAQASMVDTVLDSALTMCMPYARIMEGRKSRKDGEESVSVQVMGEVEEMFMC
jgi:hypothetical protein